MSANHDSSQDEEDLPLFSAEEDCIQELQAILGKHLPRIDPRFASSYGYNSRGGHVRKLYLRRAANLTPFEIKWRGYEEEGSKTPLTSLPKSIQALKWLEYISLDGHNFPDPESFPDEFGDLPVLNSLAIANCHLKNVPPAIKHLKSLGFLSISDPIESLPDWIGDLFHLHTLYLERSGLQETTKISTLPESIGHLRNLTRLTVIGHRLVTLPESMGGLTRLTDLNLACNRLASLPDSIGRLTNLERLDISRNCLTSLPGSIGKLANLQRFNLSGNGLISLPKTIEGLAALQVLDASDNALESLPDTVGNLRALREIYIQNDLPNRQDYQELQRLLRDRKKKEKNLEQFQKLLATFLNVDPEAISIGNHLSELPISLNRCRALEVLNVRGNPIQRFPPGIFDLPKLRRVAMSKENVPPELRNRAGLDFSQYGEYAGEDAININFSSPYHSPPPTSNS